MDLKSYKNLVVDDHFLLRQMVSTTLKENGFTAIDWAVDGVNGLQKIKDAHDQGVPYQVVLLDWSMPNMTGYEVLRVCRGDKRFDNTAIVMLSAESEDLNIVSALEAGATAYITKPFKPEILLKKLEDVAVWHKKQGASSSATQ